MTMAKPGGLVSGTGAGSRVVNGTIITQRPTPSHPLVSIPYTDSMEPQLPFLEEEDDYDYKGALLFVVGLLSLYGVAILLLIVSLIRKSRSALEVKDHLRDFEAMRRASQKRSMRMSRENSEKAAMSSYGARPSFSARGGRCEIESPNSERFSICKTVNEEEPDISDTPSCKAASFSSLRRAPLVSPVISALRATEEHGAVAL